ncbi:MAG: hypothetical protein ACHQ9S_22735, partial [Candidatus Binatia bacterium]
VSPNVSSTCFFSTTFIHHFLPALYSKLLLPNCLTHIGREGFVLALVAVFLLAFAAVRWRYEGVIESLRERVEALKERLEAKDGQLDEYRERLHLVPASGSELSRLTHAELKGKALDLVRDLRQWLASWSAQDRQVEQREWSAMVSAADEDEKQQRWQQFTGASMQRSLERNSEYDRRFKVDAFLLRDELLSRLPGESREDRAYGMYEHPTNPIGMGIVADDLERLAKLLAT